MHGVQNVTQKGAPKVGVKKKTRDHFTRGARCFAKREREGEKRKQGRQI